MKLSTSVLVSLLTTSLATAANSEFDVATATDTPTAQSGRFKASGFRRQRNSTNGKRALDRRQARVNNAVTGAESPNKTKPVHKPPTKRVLKIIHVVGTNTSPFVPPAEPIDSGNPDNTIKPTQNLVAAAATTTTNVWRPFSNTSPWNTPIPAGPALAPDSNALITDLRTSSPYGEHLDINIPNYSIPVYYATATTPTTEVICGLGGRGFVSTNGFAAHARIPIPAGAAPDPQSDHHIAIIDRSRNTGWDMWDAHNSSGRWTCGVGASIDLTGSGVRPYKPQNPTWYTSHGARACGFPLIAGLIRTEEITAGHIDHALVIAYPHIRAGWYMSPASTAQANNGTSISTRGIPCGGRIQLDPNLNLDLLGLSRAGKIVAQALQKYGAYVSDYSGAISLYAENSASAQAYWKNVLSMYEFQGKLDMRKLRVLKYGPLTNDGNGG